MENNTNFKIIGITGGIGSGKSAFSGIIREKGFVVLDMDSRAKELMTESDELKAKIIDAFGNNTYNDDGSLNKSFLAENVFAKSAQAAKNLEKLNSIVHPAAIEDKIATIEKLMAQGNELIFVESALIYEAGLAEGYDYIINITAKKDIRIKRLTENRNLSEQDIIARMESQLSDEERIREADFNIENNGTIDDLRESALFMLDLIQSLPGKEFS